jgi:phospholipid/cholesterol/gamma-HCH transport system substrate-binding protein
MEPRVNFALVGLFVIILAGVFVLTTLWLMGVGPRGDYRTFAIYPPESVAGIVEESLVKYQGVDVGKVREIGIDPADPRRVRLLIDVRQDLPIDEHTTARLATQGLTGLVYFIELQGSEPSGQPLATAPGADHPVIRAVPSDMARLQQTGTELLDQAKDAASELRATLAAVRPLFGADQQSQIGRTLGDASKTAASLSQAAATLNTQMARLAPLLDDLSQAAGAMPGLVQRAGETLNAAGAAAGTVGQAARRMDELVAQATPGLATLTREGMPELIGLLRDLRGLTGRLDRLASDLERDPNLLLYGRPRRPGPGER